MPSPSSVPRKTSPASPTSATPPPSPPSPTSTVSRSLTLSPPFPPPAMSPASAPSSPRSSSPPTTTTARAPMPSSSLAKLASSMMSSKSSSLTPPPVPQRPLLCLHTRQETHRVHSHLLLPPHRPFHHPDVDTYNTVIKSFIESGSTGSAYSLLDEMHRVGIKSNTTTYATMLTWFYQEEWFDDVKEVLKLMKKHACHPSLTIYNVRIQSLCKLKRPGEAMELLKEKLMKPNSVTYNHLIYGFCVVGDLEEAKRLYKEMPSRGLVPESQCCFTLISYLCSGGDLTSALEVCKECLEKMWVLPLKTMKALVNVLIGSLKFEEAGEIIEKVKEKFPNEADRWKEVEEGLPQ